MTNVNVRFAVLCVHRHSDTRGRLPVVSREWSVPAEGVGSHKTHVRDSRAYGTPNYHDVSTVLARTEHPYSPERPPPRSVFASSGEACHGA